MSALIRKMYASLLHWSYNSQSALNQDSLSQSALVNGFPYAIPSDSISLDSNPVKNRTPWPTGAVQVVVAGQDFVLLSYRAPRTSPHRSICSGLALPYAANSTTPRAVYITIAQIWPLVSSPSHCQALISTMVFWSFAIKWSTRWFAWICPWTKGCLGCKGWQTLL